MALQGFEIVAASQTDQVLGGTGSIGDQIDFLLVIPASTSPGAVSITNGAGSPMTIFAGGATSVGSLAPFPVPLGNIRSTTGPWKVTTGPNVSVLAVGDFT